MKIQVSLLFLFTISSFSSAISQENLNSPESIYNFRVGVKTEFRLNNVVSNFFPVWSNGFTTYEVDKSASGFSVGAFIIYDFDKHQFIQPEFLFNNTTFKYNMSQERFSNRNLYSASFSLPYNYRVYKDKISINIGPQVDYLFKNSYNYIIPGSSYSYGGEFENMAPTFSNKLTFSVIGGVQLKNNSWIIGARYMYGISQVDSKFIYNESKIRLTSFQLSLGYIFF
jgi:hypothetical protein